MASQAGDKLKQPLAAIAMASVVAATVYFARGRARREREQRMAHSIDARAQAGKDSTANREGAGSH